MKISSNLHWCIQVNNILRIQMITAGDPLSETCYMHGPQGCAVHS